MSPFVEIQIITILVAVTCSIPGVFLVLRKMAMMTDAISHTILLGIVAAYFIVFDLRSPLLIIGAASVGVLTVYFVELLRNTKLMYEDAAIGVVFPLLFSIAIIIISRHAANVHLDVDSVLLGEVAFAPFYRLTLFGVDIGPIAFYIMGTILILNLIYLLLFYKELKIVTFDAKLAAVLGISPIFIHYSLMSLVSITAVGAFEAVGSILVIAFMIGPPITAYLLTEKLHRMIIYSMLIGAFNAIIGFQVAIIFDVSIAGMMASVTGLTFMIIFLIAPKSGLLSLYRSRKQKRIKFAVHTMLYHLLNHERDEDLSETHVETIHTHLNWNRIFLNKIIKKAKSCGFIFIKNQVLILSETGRTYALENYSSIVNSG